MTETREVVLSSLVLAPESALRTTLATSLRARGFSVSLCANAKRASTALERAPFHLVVLAWPGPKESAAELCRRIAGSAQDGRPFVLAVLEAPGVEVAPAALAVGADDYVTLPVELSTLDSRLCVAERHIRRSLQRKVDADELRASEGRYGIAAGMTNGGLWDWDLVADQTRFSERWLSMLGLQASDVEPSPDEWFSRVHPGDLPRLKAAIAAHLSGGTTVFECEYRILHSDGSQRWMLGRGLASRDEEGRPLRLAGSQTDVTERRRAEEQLVYDTFHDPVTSLPNRALFMERLAQALVRSKRHGEATFAVLFLDVDQFKLVNDSLGHRAGDQLLVGIAQRLEEPLRAGDTVARFSGDEFAVLLDEVPDVRQTISVVERIHQAIRRPFELAGREVYATASTGIVMSGPGYENPEEVLRDADTAMYRAKSLGRDRYAVFDHAMHERAVVRLQLENDLRRAVDRGEFIVHYQPIVSLDTGSIVGFEALARWRHPSRGLVLPSEFISLAEETGLIVPIDRVVIHEACRQLRQWHVQFRRTPPLTVAVNISGVQFMQADLTMATDRALRENGLYGDVLKIEITESVMMDRARYAPALLEQLRALNIRLSIDDFGTGYSSLAYLRRFEIDTLKIDASFVSKLGADEESSEIVRAIIALARNLGKDVIAEGVENSSQLAGLRELHCPFAQGNLFSEPLPADMATRLIAADRRW